MLTKEAIGRLEKDLHGGLIQAQDKRYDDARRVWNGLIDKRPALIAQCVDDSDVACAVNFARDHDVLLAVRGVGIMSPVSARATTAWSSICPT